MPLIMKPGAWFASNPAISGALKSGSFGNPELASLSQAIDYVDKAAQWASRNSTTALAILAAVRYDARKVYLVPMRNGGYSCFDSDCPVEGEGTVYFNLDLRLKVKIRDGVTADTRDPKYKTARKTMDPLIAFFHELGHAKQWIENPSFYGIKVSDFKQNAQGQYVGAPPGTDTVEKLQKILSPGQMMPATTAFRNEVLAKASQVAGRVAAGPGNTLTAGQAITKGKEILMLQENSRSRKVRTELHREPIPERQTAPAWGVRIETDNLIRHEWPICRELGWREPELRHYTDLEMG